MWYGKGMDGIPLNRLVADAFVLFVSVCVILCAIVFVALQRVEFPLLVHAIVKIVIILTVSVMATILCLALRLAIILYGLQ